MSYLGDYAEDFADLNFKFNTRQFSTGAPFALAGTPVVSVYKSNDATQTTAGITLTNPFDSVVGLMHVNIDLSADAFYVTGEDYQVVLTAGTVDSVSVIGAVLADFSIENRFMRGTDGVDTATMRGTDGVDTATMRGTDGVDTATMRGTDSALLASSAPTNFGALGIESDGDITKVNLLDGNTAQTGDNFARLGAPAGASIAADIAALEAADIKKNTAYPNFTFLMVLTSDHVTPATGLTVTGERRLDNGSFTAVSGTISEVSNGMYEFDALAADTNADTGAWRFSAATADDVFITFKTSA